MTSVKHHFAAASLALLLTCAMARATQDTPEPASGFAPRALASSQRSMVVAAHPIAAEIGRTILRSGGTAADAAVAVQLALNVVEPQSSGLGGGAFMLHFDAAKGELSAWDGRETAPAAARGDRFLDAEGKPRRFHDVLNGPRAVGVPGTLRLLELTHREFGKLPWAMLFQPAVRLAREGFAMSPRLAQLVARDPLLGTHAAARAIYFDVEGRPLAVGSTIRNPQLADLLEKIAQDGADVLYRGAYAEALVAALKANPNEASDLTLADLAAYRALKRTAVCSAYRAWRVCGMPPPSAGGIGVLQMLGIMAPFDLAALDPLGVDSVHLFSEAGRLAYADRGRYIADPDYVPVPVSDLIAPDYLARRSALIDRTRSMGRASAGSIDAEHSLRGEDASPELPATSHFSIVDAAGNAVAMSTTIEDAFGSRQLVAGLLLNNEMTDFSWIPMDEGKPVANRIEGGKRPRSAMAPVMVFSADGKLFAIAGSPGGPAIINFVARALVAVLDWGHDAQTAASLPHYGSRNGPTELEAGRGLEALEPELRRRGHEVRFGEFPSGLHLIVRTPTGWSAGADPRREGVGLGD